MVPRTDGELAATDFVKIQAGVFATPRTKICASVAACYCITCNLALGVPSCRPKIGVQKLGGTVNHALWTSRNIQRHSALHVEENQRGSTIIMDEAFPQDID